MTLPKRRPIRLTHDAGMSDIARRLNDAAGAMDLGWSMLKAERSAAGHRTRTPDDDRKPQTQASEGDSLDYADPTGELAIRLDNLHDDLDTLQSHRNIVETSLAAIRRITAKYVQVSPSLPMCTVGDCTETVERTGNGNGYRGCKLVAGVWVQSGDQRPTCAKHRRRRERAA